MRQISLLGHRGARGLLAENTLASLAKPFEFGAHGIEFDLQLSKDNELVIYHDLRLKSNITRDLNGNWIAKPGPAIRDLSLKQLKQYRIGRVNKQTTYGIKFRKQKISHDQTIPTLSELVEYFDRQNLNQAVLNIEIKHSPLETEICPRPATIARHVVDEIHRLNISDRCVISCFNWAVIKAIREIDHLLEIGCLTTIDPLDDTLSPLNGKPSPWTVGLDIRNFNHIVPDMVAAFGAEYWIPYIKNLNKNSIDIAHLRGLKVFTWTVNHKATMKKLMRWNVDGIITDYPDKLQNVWQEWSSKNHK